ncbi:MAG: D-alanyl-D-alanine carboxypeptidase [Flavobacterium sp.]|nr:MAG: D-alanyl-D-alanine carboxypeptidase [Flavobacterium sp.] [Flavobacterium sp. FEMGT703F]
MKKLLLLFLFGLSSVFAQTDKFQKIDSLLNFLYTNNKFMGSLSILEKDKIVFSKAYGLAELSSGKKLNPATKLKIGSITKTFTATMIMQLVDEKKLSLDTKLSQFYPKVANADKITIAMLLHHRTGIPDFLNDDPTVAQYIYIENKKADLLKRIEGYTSAFEPDSQFKYSNSNYNLLGYIVEDITKKSYAENLNTRIVKKLGLKNTSFPVKIEPSQNEGYSFTFNGNAWEQTPEWHNSLAFAAGAIASTPDDLNLFLSGLFNGKLVSAGSLDQMKTIKDSYGKGLIIAPFDERKFYGHTGGIENFRAAAGYNMEEKNGFAIVVNGDNFNRNEIMIGVLSFYYGKDYQFPDVKGFAVSETLRAKYVGTYSSKSIPIKITIAESNGQLTAQATGQSAFPLTATSETDFVFETAGIQMIFSNQKMILKQGGMEFEFTKE